ncbi:MAG: hypothetical protein FWH14_08090, partial [Oscillospiraceae bacterium]|nr:hypothetical protein [Oscillospiraceae bacterium]
PSGEGCRRSGGGVCLKTPSPSALPPTALPKGEPRVSYTNSVCVLASPFGRGVTPWRDGEGMTERA